MQQSPGFANMQGMQGSANMQPGTPAAGGRMQQSSGFANFPPTATNENAQFMNAQFSSQDNTLPMFPPRRESAVTGYSEEGEKKRSYEQVGTTFLGEEPQTPSAILAHVDDGKATRITKTKILFVSDERFDTSDYVGSFL